VLYAVRCCEVKKLVEEVVEFARWEEGGRIGQSYEWGHPANPKVL
jgi:hypothetical protein